MAGIGEAFIEILPTTVGFAEALKTQVKGHLDAVSKDTTGALGSLASVGKTAMLGIAGGAAAVGVASIKMAADFQESLTKLVTGAGESEANMELVKKGIMQMGPQVGMTAKQLSDGMFLIESAGYHGADGLNVLKAAAQGAKTGGAELSVVGNALTTVLTDYHLPASQAAAVTSQLVETVASGKTTMQDLAGSMSTVLPVAAASGVSFAQVSGAMATMTGQGISAQQSAQNVVASIRAFSNPTQAASKAMAQLGLDATDLAQNLGTRGLTGTFDLVVTKIASQMGPSGLVLIDTFKKSKQAATDAGIELAHLPSSIQKVAQGFAAGTITQGEYNHAIKDLPVAQRELAKQFALTEKGSRGFSDALKSGGPAAETMSKALTQVMGGADGYNAALALTGPNMATFTANVANITEAGKNGAKQVQGFAATQKDFNFQIDQAKAVASNLAITIGDKLIPIVLSAAHALEDAFHWLQQHKDVALALAGVIGGALALAIGAFAVLTVKKLVDNVGAAGKAIGKLVTSLFGVATAEEETAAVSEATGGGLGPMGIAIGAVVLAATLLATHWKEVWSFIKGVADDAWKFIKGVADEAWHWLDSSVLKPLENALRGPWEAVRGPVMAVVDFIEEHWRLLVPILLIPLAPLIEIALHFGTFKNIVMDVWHAVSSAVMTAYNVLKPIFETIASVLLQVLGVAFTIFRALAEVVWVAIQIAIKVAWDVIKVIWDAIANYLMPVLGVAFSIFRALVEVAWVAIQIAIKVAWLAIKVIFGLAVAFVNDVLGPVFMWLWHEVIDPVFRAVGKLISAAWNDVIKPVFSAFTGFLRDDLAPAISWAHDKVVKPVFNAIGGVINTVWKEGIKPPLDAFLSFLATDIPQALSKIAGVFSSVWSGIGQAVGWAWQNLIVQPIQDGINLVIDGVNLLIRGVKDVAKLVGVDTGGLNTIDKFGQSKPNPAISETIAGSPGMGNYSGYGGNMANSAAGFASGGTLPISEVGQGFITNGIRGIVGEGGPHPEFVIPTDPQHRGNAMSLLVQAAQAMGLAHDKGGILGTITGAISGAVGAVGDVLGTLRTAGADLVLKPLFDGVNTLIGPAPKFVKGFVTYLEDKIMSWVRGTVTQKAQQSGGGGGAAAPAQVNAWIEQALGLMGLPLSLENGVAQIIMRESSGNPQAINLTDINAIAGHPSKGLMQTIPSTFAAYVLPSLAGAGIYDPVANITAGVRYALANYGMPWLAAGGNHTTVGRTGYASGGILPFTGYDSGGILPPGVTMAYNGTGRNERIISPDGAGGGGVHVAAGAVQVSVTLGGDGGGLTVGTVEQVMHDAITKALNDVLTVAGNL